MDGFRLYYFVLKGFLCAEIYIRLFELEVGIFGRINVEFNLRLFNLSVEIVLGIYLWIWLRKKSLF